MLFLCLGQDVGFAYHRGDGAEGTQQTQLNASQDKGTRFRVVLYGSKKVKKKGNESGESIKKDETVSVIIVIMCRGSVSSLAGRLWITTPSMLDVADWKANPLARNVSRE